MQWLKVNLPTIIPAAVLLVFLIAAVVSVVRGKGSGCGCGCADCPAKKDGHCDK